MASDSAPRPAEAAADPWGDLLDACQEGLALLDAQGVVLWANAAMAAACGRPSSGMAGQPWAALLPGPGAPTPAGAAAPTQVRSPPLEDLLRDALNRRQPLEWPGLAWRDAAGESRSGRARLRPWASPGHPRAVALCSLQDTTVLDTLQRERDRAVERLQRAQDFGRLALFERALPIGRGEWDEAMFRLWGFDPAQGTPSFDQVESRIHPDDQPGQDYRRSAHRAGKYGKRYRVMLPDGQVRHVLSRWEVLDGPDGQPNLLRGVMVDDTEVYEMAESYSKASAQLELAAELGHIVVWRHELGSDRVHCSARAVEVLGVTPRPEGNALAELHARVHPEDLPRLRRANEASMGTDRPMDAEARFLRDDGSYRYVLTRRVLRRSALGEPLEFVGVALDVSDQVAETRRSQELARRLEVAAAAAGLGIWSRDSDLRRGEWNRQLFEIVGRPPEDGVPTRRQWLEQMVHPEDRERMARAHDELRATEDVTVEHEFRIVRPDGQTRWLVNRASHTRRDGRSMEFGVTLDVTDRVATESALRQANERIALATRGAGIGTWEIDLASGQAAWDDQMYELYGQRGREGDPIALWTALVHPQDLERGRLAYEESVRTGSSGYFEVRVRQPDGSLRWLASRWVPQVDERGGKARLVGVSWDVHERVTAEAVRHEKLMAQRESQAKSAFLARMSHELRTPLNAVLGFAQLLQFDPALKRPEPLQKLRHIQAAGEHLLALVNDVLDLSGLESGELRLEAGSVALADLLPDALALMEPAAHSAGVRLVAARSDAWVLADRTRLRQVLLNLLSNAIKYNQPGGRVELTVEHDAGHVMLAVTDTGRGMRAEQLAHLFEPFNRLGVESEGIEGAGIGLAVVKALVERMGGTVRATSQPGRGSRFELRLAVAPAAEPAPPGDTTRFAAPGPVIPLTGRRRGRLLYVEDNAVNALLVEELVRSHAGLTIEIAPTGVDGVAQALANPPDLVLIDMQLPDISGAEVFKRLQAGPATALTPCIALSANALPEDAERALALGFVEYWTKPIDIADFLAALDRLFPADQDTKLPAAH
jgi:PAS domain S-box-containing protein